MNHRPPAAPRPRLFTPSFTALLISQACFGYAFSSFFLLPTFMATKLGASASEVGWVMSAASGSIVVFLPFAGMAVDRHGRRGFLIAGGLLMGVACLGFVGVGSVGPRLYGLRVLQALAFSMAFAAGGALAVDEAPPERVGQAMGLFGLTFLAMNGVAGAAVEQIARHVGWDGAFGVAGASAFACAGLALRVHDAFVPHPPGAVAVREGGPVAVRSMIIMACIGAALLAMFNFAQLHAKALGFSNVSRFFVAYAVAASVVRVGFGHLLDAWGHRRVSLAAITLYIFVVLATVRLDVFGLGLIGALLGLSHGMFYPAFSAASLVEGGPAARGRVIAFVQAAFNVGAASSAVLGMLADRAGYAVVFEAAAAILALGWVLLITSPVARPAASADPGFPVP
jgi:MFS family permease